MHTAQSANKFTTTAVAALAGVATVAVTVRLFRAWIRGRGSVQCKFPRDLDTWRLLDGAETVLVWEAVRPTLHDAGICLWTYDGASSRANSEQNDVSNGFAYVTSVRGEAWSQNLTMFNCHNELTWGGSTTGGLNVVIRVAAIGNEGKKHVEILRKLARGTISLMTNNHVVPLWKEVQLHDIIFVISPYVGYSMDQCYGRWANNSVGDIVDMIIQALEAIAFVHSLGIVHRDLCKANYVVQWHPESLSTMRVPLSRPRAFLTDFETAHEFPPELPVKQRWLTGPPVERYQRPVPPEMASGSPYDPFKADVWQLAESFSDFKTTVLDIDAVLAQMFEPDTSLRLSASEARDKLAEVVHSIPPTSLLIPPLLLNPLPDF
ncbi:kinase-like domain-containing protein [Fomitopsis serialis]|uniref:kinase-like domain-containing protein n=1 Tax=Fomitopsis serialis TaxID=139415 RepID=UPI002008014E|nr:kinase-like domain-containing protein [Neoantrodia serialis]KAH9920663.1 kinase-like domain-containing protein [Neoantrodia serialis]